MRFAFGLVVLTQVFGQSSPDATALMARQGEELQRYRSYEYTQDMTMSIVMPGMTMPAMTYTTVMQAVNPGKTRMEMKMPGMDGMLMVSDGKQTWMYMPMLKQYSRIESSAADGQEILNGMGMASLPDVKSLAANAKVVGSELLDVDGQKHDCWVVESRTDKLAVPAQARAEMRDVVQTAWIDKTLGMQLKMTMTAKVNTGAAPAMETRVTMTTHSMKFNEDLPDSLFVFTPPPDAKETKDLLSGLGAIAGGAAPAAKSEATVKAEASLKTDPGKSSTPGEPEAFIPALSPIENIEPVYPPEARSQGVQGFVELLVTIDPKGAVVNAEPLTGREALRAAAVDTVKQERFRPVYRNGHPVPAYTQTSVFFVIDPGTPKKLGPDLDLADEMKSQGRIEELMQRFPRSAEQKLSDAEDQSRGLEGIERFYALPQLAQAALDAGALAKASSYATELLQLAQENKTDSSYGSVVFDGNTVLGLVALRQGSVTQARQYLLESGKAPASGFQRPFGPDLTLARELAAKGEREAVLEFLTLCKGFWKSGTDQLDGMAEAVRKGETF